MNSKYRWSLAGKRAHLTVSLAGRQKWYVSKAIIKIHENVLRQSLPKIVPEET